MEIRKLKDNEEQIWDEYVLKSKSSTFYHLIGWKNVVEKTYGHEPFYLIAEEKGEIMGILPLFLLKSRNFGRKLVSVPFAPYGGVCAENSEIENALIENVKTLAKGKNTDYLELRSLDDKRENVETNDAYWTLILKLERDPELLWNRFDRKLRNAVRKGMKSNLSVEIGKDSCTDFYTIYSKNMRDLGAPVHSNTFFRNLLLEFPEQTNIATVSYEEKIIASIFLLYFKDTIISGWAASDRSFLNFNPNNILYWNTIKTACEEGYTYFDFGRSIMDSGTYHFKKSWGVEPKQMHYQYCLYNINKIPDTTQANRKRKMFARVYKQLPLTITNIIGPKLRRNFP
ncbi:MAG: FemAB superfamily protein [Clostridia bacterium]|jgi:FemAB-related protein (PEP-CTERM system-associated)|nr:FemAB superfamily protein [Clostridia bacterium]